MPFPSAIADAADRDAAKPAIAAVGRRRWTICALLFFATTINYLDRQVLGILAPDLQKTLGWSEVDYGNIVAAFQAAYAIGLVAVGSVLDRVGTRRGFSVAITIWSLAAMAHALAGSALGFGIARFALGLGESGNFPAAIKTITEWFPKRERAFATGIMNSGANIGAIVAPLTVPVIALSFGWQWAFIATGMIGFLWLVSWIILYRHPDEDPALSAAERRYIHSDSAAGDTNIGPKISWFSLLGYPQTWAFAIGKLLTDPVWWFYLSWLPKFLNKTYGIKLDKLGLPLVVVYVLSDIGSIGGGWISSVLLRQGRSVNFSRKVAMLICALCVVPIIFASQTSNQWVAVLLVGLAAAAHQGWSANIFTLASDMFPRRAVGSVVGFGGMVGAVGGMFVAAGVGLLLQATHGNYIPLFLIAGFAYLVALLIVHILAPNLAPAPIPGTEAAPGGNR